MERIITRFISALRERGVRVSPAETLDAVRALGLAGVDSRETVRSILRLTLMKNVNEMLAFEEVFERFFSTSHDIPMGLQGMDLLAAMIHIVEGEQLKADAFRTHKDEEGPTLLVDEEVTAEDLENLLGLEDSDGEDDGAELMIQLEGYRGKRDAPAPSEFRMDNIPTVAYSPGTRAAKHVAVTPEELADMQDVVCRMLVRIRKDVRRMREMESRGKLNVIRTIQKNYRHGMVPFLLSLRRKRKEKPRLVVFCDVSYSVSHATRFMLLLLHTLASRVMDVRSFVLNRDVVEITDLLRNMPANCLLETIDSGDIVNLDDNSDYGNVFETFKKKHLENMRGKPAIIIMGDGRNNYNEAKDWALEEIREKAGYLLWLTPEDRELWSRGDCLMELYGSYCDKVEVVRSVDELSLVVEELFCTLYDHHDTRAWKGRRHETKDDEQYNYWNYYNKAAAADQPVFAMQPSPASREWRERFGTRYKARK